MDDDSDIGENADNDNEGGDGKDDDGSFNGEDGSDDDGDVENDEQVKKLSDRRGRLHNAHMKTSSQLDNLKYSASEIGTQFEWYHWSQRSHWIPFWFLLTGFSHLTHGYL